MNILDKANNIINERSEEKERQYGPFSEGMKRATAIFNGMTGLDLKPEEMFKALVALKLSRERYIKKNLLSMVVHIYVLYGKTYMIMKN
jgi:DNA-binding protein H-NS